MSPPLIDYLLSGETRPAVVTLWLDTLTEDMCG